MKTIGIVSFQHGPAPHDTLTPVGRGVPQCARNGQRTGHLILDDLLAAGIVIKNKNKKDNRSKLSKQLSLFFNIKVMAFPNLSLKAL